MDDDYERRFGSCKVNWKIENFCFAYPLDNWSIFSSIFILQGLKSVKWRISLELEKYAVGRVSVYLEKLPFLEENNADSSLICVSWELKLTAGSKEFGPYEKNIEFGEVCKHGQVGIVTTREIFKHLDPFKPDTVVISLYFVAFYKNKCSKSEDKLPRGLFLLSEDLKHLKDIEKNYTDIKLKVNGEYIPANKVILCRNDQFYRYVHEAQNNTIEILNFDYKTLNGFVDFLYSGNAGYCLANLSISMVRCMEHFKCDALDPYYIPEEISLNSKVKVEKHDFQWHVYDFFNRDNFDFPSPPIRILHAGTTWNLTVALKTVDQDRFISIFAHITRGDMPKHFCLEFALTNDSKKKHFPKRLLKHFPINPNEDFGFDNFVRTRDILYNPSLTLDGHIRICFRVRTSDCTQESSIGRCTMTFILPIASKSYKRLSAQMLDFLKDGLYCDVTIKCKDNKTINAHKCILVARSPGFQRRIESELFDDNTLNIWDIDYEVVKQSIRYIYKGSFDDDMKDVMTPLYCNSFPDKLDIPSLHEESRKFLQEF